MTTSSQAEKSANKIPLSQLINTHTQFPVGPGEAKTGNLPEMLRNNILSSQYFKDLYALKTI